MTLLYGRNSSITWMTALENHALANRERAAVVMRVKILKCFVDKFCKTAKILP